MQTNQNELLEEIKKHEYIWINPKKDNKDVLLFISYYELQNFINELKRVVGFDINFNCFLKDNYVAIPMKNIIEKKLNLSLKEIFDYNKFFS